MRKLFWESVTFSINFVCDDTILLSSGLRCSLLRRNIWRNVQWETGQMCRGKGSGVTNSKRRLLYIFCFFLLFLLFIYGFVFCSFSSLIFHVLPPLILINRNTLHERHPQSNAFSPPLKFRIFFFFKFNTIRLLLLSLPYVAYFFFALMIRLNRTMGQADASWIGKSNNGFLLFRRACLLVSCHAFDWTLAMTSRKCLTIMIIYRIITGEDVNN